MTSVVATSCEEGSEGSVLVRPSLIARIVGSFEHFAPSSE